MTQEIQVFKEGTQNELPPIFKHSFNGVTKNAVYFREVYNKIGLAPLSFARWCKQNIEDTFEKGDEWHLQHNAVNSSRSHKSGRYAIDYIIPVDIAKELSMLARTSEGKMFRRMFIEAEKKLVTIMQQAQKQVTIGEETSKFFNNLLENISIYSPTAKITMAATIAERVYGIKVPYTALPPANIPRLSATEIGVELGCSAIAIGKIVNILDLRKYPYAEMRLSIAKHTNKEVSMAYYNEEAVKLIKNHYYKTNQIINE